MNNFLLMVLSGLLFGSGGLLLKKSGLSSTMAAMVYYTTALVFVLPFVFLSGVGTMTIRGLLTVGIAGCIGGVACLIFNDVIVKADNKAIGVLILIMLVAQLMPPTIHYVIMNGHITPKKTAGIATAVLAAYLLK